MVGDTTFQQMQFLSASPLRIRILEVLNNSQSTVRTIMENVDAPRSTVQRNLSSLDDKGWIMRSDSGYKTTKVGKLVCSSFKDFRHTIDTIRQMSPFLKSIDGDLMISIEKLCGASITTPSPKEPNAPTRVLIDSFSGAQRVQALIPVVSQMLLDRLLGEGTDIEVYDFVLSEPAANVWRDTDVGEDSEGSEETRFYSISIKLFSGSIPYGIFLSYNQVALCAYDNCGRIEAIVVTSREEAVDRANAIFDQFKGKSEQLESDRMVSY